MRFVYFVAAATSTLFLSALTPDDSGELPVVQWTGPKAEAVQAAARRYQSVDPYALFTATESGLLEDGHIMAAEQTVAFGRRPIDILAGQTEETKARFVGSRHQEIGTVAIIRVYIKEEHGFDHEHGLTVVQTRFGYRADGDEIKAIVKDSVSITSSIEERGAEEALASVVRSLR